MRIRGPLIGLSLFMIGAVTLTWLVYVTLRRDVAGSTTGYAAVFSDVYGLREGDDVRMAGVRVGRVESVDLQGQHAKVAFDVQTDQHVFANTTASVTYQNIVGQRYLQLSLGTDTDTRILSPGSIIPLQRTEPSFDVGTLLNGYEPLFSVLNPHDADNLTQGVLRSLQGDEASIATLIGQTSTLTEAFAGRDQALGTMITNLNKVMINLDAQNTNLDKAITQTHDIIGNFDRRRPALVAATGSLARVLRRLSAISDTVTPALNDLVTRQPGFSKHMVTIEPQLAFTGDNLPLLLKGLARITNEGAFANAYACDLNATGFFPGFNDVVPIIVNAATPGNRAWHTPRCRNMADG